MKKIISIKPVDTTVKTIGMATLRARSSKKIRLIHSHWEIELNIPSIVSKLPESVSALTRAKEIDASSPLRPKLAVRLEETRSYWQPNNCKLIRIFSLSTACYNRTLVHNRILVFKFARICSYLTGILSGD
jgi:hypothetical protein